MIFMDVVNPQVAIPESMFGLVAKISEYHTHRCDVIIYQHSVEMLFVERELFQLLFLQVRVRRESDIVHWRMRLFASARGSLPFKMP
jgi:hypothetical protein